MAARATLLDLGLGFLGAGGLQCLRGCQLLMLSGVEGFEALMVSNVVLGKEVIPARWAKG